MGVYDFLKGPCPTCGQEIGADSGDIQIKWFSSPVGECFRTFRPGDELPMPMEDGLYSCGTWTYCCNDLRILFADIRDNKFVGFQRAKVTRQQAEQAFKEQLGMGDDPKFQVKLVL